MGWRDRRSLPLWTACALILANLIATDLFAWIFTLAECEHMAAPAPSGRVRVVVLSDPQLTDRTSYGFLPPGPLLSAVMLLSDAYMARCAACLAHPKTGDPARSNDAQGAIWLMTGACAVMWQGFANGASSTPRRDHLLG